MKNLYTDIETDREKTKYKLNFITDDRGAYEAVLAVAQRILDGKDEPAAPHFEMFREKCEKQGDIVYICSPYRGDTARNVAYARELVNHVVQRGASPICPHLYLPQILDDDKPEEREQALRVGLEILKGCDVLLVGDRYGISEGMQGEIDKAIELGMLVRYYS